MSRSNALPIRGPRRRVLRAGAAWLIAPFWAEPLPAQCVPEWSNLGTNIAGAVNGTSPAWGNPGSPYPAYLAVGGGWDQPGTVMYHKAALWDGWRWLFPGAPLSTYGVEDVEAPAPGGGGVAFYAGGSFGHAGQLPVDNIVLWSLGEWSEPGGGIENGHPFALFWCSGPTPLGPALYGGGPFATAGGQPIQGLARWDGVNWTEVGGGLFNPGPVNDASARAFALYDDDGPGPRPTGLYVGGPFEYAGGLLVQSVARWNGTSWEPLQGGTGSDVRAMAAFDHDGPGPARESLFVGGSYPYAYNYAGGVEVRGLGRWDGTSWHTVPGWIGNSPRDLAVFDDDGPGPNKPALFVAGYFITAGNLGTNHIAKWDGQEWYSVGGGVSGSPFGTPEISTLDVFDEDGPGPNPGGLYVGGFFDNAGTIPAPRIARWGCPLPPRCDANCNRDFHPVTGQPLLTVADFGCFQTRFVAGCP